MKTFLTLIISLITLMAVGQKKQTKADVLFEQMRYKDAAKEYEKSFDTGDKSIEIMQKAGDSYYFNTDMDEAAKWYDKLFVEHTTDSIESRYAFRFVHSLKGAGKYEKAKTMIKFFGNSGMLNPIQVEQLKEVNELQIDELINMEPTFKVFNQHGINSRYSDFSPMFYKNEVIFSSSRDTMNLETREYHWNKQPFLDLYITKPQLDREKWTKNVTTESEKYSHLKLVGYREFSEELNTRYHEASVAFTPDEKTIYFTRNNFKENQKGKLKRGQDGINHLKLYRASYIQNIKSKVRDSIWSNVEELPFNNESYSVGHPALSTDGRTLYFTSDMPGGFGATDIYKVEIKEDGSFSTPENLGENINTAGREMYPYASESRFYYSSDGKLGLGGLDVFESFFDENVGFSNPINLGGPLNSMKDDFGFIIDEDTQTGYFSSNREGGKGDDDIYSFIREKRTAINVKVACVQMTNGSVIDKINKKPIANATVKLFNEATDLIETTSTDADGRFEFKTALDCKKQFSVNASKDMYGQESKEFTTSTEQSLELDLSLKVDPIIDLIYIDNGLKKFKIDNLNFDINKDNIRPDAAAELDKIVSVMTEYPSIVIKIEAHTDSRGSDAYNEKLSDRRAKSTRNYLVNNGIALDRIESAIGYGEKRLLNECGNGVRCSNEKHDVNRRSDFIITNM